MIDPSGRIASLPTQDRVKLRTPLDHAAAAALRGLSAGALRPVIAAADAAPLLAAGYARAVPGAGYILTDVGQARAIIEGFLR